MKKFAATATIVGALGLGALGLSGPASADDDLWWFNPPPPGQVGQIVNVPPGQVGHWVGVPPGHWDKPWKWFN
jgi:hypothetical protein